MSDAGVAMNEYWKRVRNIVTDTKKYSKQQRDIVWKDFVKLCDKVIDLTSEQTINKEIIELMRKDKLKKLKEQS